MIVKIFTNFLEYLMIRLSLKFYINTTLFYFQLNNNYAKIIEINEKKKAQLFSCYYWEILVRFFINQFLNKSEKNNKYVISLLQNKTQHKKKNK